MAKQVAIYYKLASAATFLSLLLLVSNAFASMAAEEPARESSVASDQEPTEAPLSLFRKDVIDKEFLDSMDCHLRNMDYCLAGIIGASGKILPETDVQLESRCDELKASTTCLEAYNERCQTFKIFSSTVPQLKSMPLISKLRENATELGNQAAPLNLTIEILLGPEPDEDKKFGVIDILELCDPEKKGTKQNNALRKKLFELTKCINVKLPGIKLCVEDAKTALQLLFEPGRTLPLKQTCCAWGRFRSCAMDALDSVCGFSSFKQIEAALKVGPMSMLNSIQVVCKAEQDHTSPYCKQVLPPSGLKVPARRGQKASKFAKVLDVIQFSFI